jgi:hypothetical protein
MAKTTKTAKKNGNGSNAHSFEAQVASVITTASALLQSMKALGLPVLTDEERTHTMGKLRGGEAAVMNSVFDTVDANPVVFESLADQDGGNDPNVVETQPSRDALDRFASLAPLSTVLAEMQTVVSDGMIANGQFAKELSVPAYAIGKALSVTNAKIRTSMAKALTFYGSSARKTVAGKKRAANVVKRAAKTAKASGSANA